MARRVLQLLGPSAGGIRAHVAELARRLPAHGWQPSVICSHDVMAGIGPQHGDLDVPPMWNVTAYRPARRRLAEMVEGHDVLHVHGLKAAMVAVGLTDRPPMVLTVHNLVAGTQPWAVRPVLQRLESHLVARADHLIVISDEIEQRFADVIGADRRSFVLPVSPPRTVGRTRDEVRREHGIAADAPLVTIVARHHRQKNLTMFLDAVAVAVAAVPGLRVLMVGDGPDRADLERHRSSLGLDGIVVMTGQRPNPVDEMHAADVVGLSSDWEGSPLVVAECLAVGRPLVATAVGTVTRHLVDGVSARITPVGAAPAFAAAMIELLSDPVRAAAIAAAGHRVGAVVFDPDSLVDGVARVYDGLVAP
ncbi:MAG: glycosyltransferase family 4 protein [Ilumatobacteraceae bacterium]